MYIKEVFIIPFNEISKHSKSTIKAFKLLNKSVVSVNEDAIVDYIDMISIGKIPYYLGVKDVKGINKDILSKLKKEGFICHTIDQKSVGGRAIDTMLINPLTGRFMTGSSSATAINVLLGINDIGIGTDGGGSVLAPAISVHLYSFLAKGLGLKLNQNKKSTDGISFEPGIGFISKNLNILCKVINIFSNEYNKNINQANYTIEHIKYSEDESFDFTNLQPNITTKKINIYNNRKDLIKDLQSLKKENTIYISYEKNIDTYGIGDSIVGTFSTTGQNLQQEANKGILRVLNMIDVNCLTIPDIELSSTFILYSFDNNMVNKMLELGEKLDSLINKNNIFENYFKDNYDFRSNSIIFDID